MASSRDWVSELPPDYRDDLEHINALAASVRDRQRARMAQAMTDACEAEAAGQDAYPFRQLAADLSAALGETGDTVDELAVRVEALEQQVREIRSVWGSVEEEACP